MPRFNVEVTMQVSATVEADDADEAEQIVHDGLSSLDHSMLETIDVEDIETESCVLAGADDD